MILPQWLGRLSPEFERFGLGLQTTILIMSVSLLHGDLFELEKKEGLLVDLLGREFESKLCLRHVFLPLKGLGTAKILKEDVYAES